MDCKGILARMIRRFEKCTMQEGGISEKNAMQNMLMVINVRKKKCFLGNYNPVYQDEKIIRRTNQCVKCKK